jgi:hypothetical protein
MCLTDRRRDTSYNYISPEAQDLQLTLSNSTEGGLVKIAQFEEFRLQAASRSLGSKSTKPHEEEPSRGGRY